MGQNKQTAVEWLQECLDLHLNHEQKMQYEGLFQQAKEMEKQQSLELPSDEEIDAYVKSTGYYGHCTSEYHEGIEQGAKWMRDKIQGVDK